MQRMILLITLMGVFAGPLVAQERFSEQIPVRGFDWWYTDSHLYGSPVGPLNESQVLMRFSRIYAYKSWITEAQAQGDANRVRDLVSWVRVEMHHLARRQDIAGQPLYRALRELLTEYESYYNYGELGDTVPPQTDEVSVLTIPVEELSWSDLYLNQYYPVLSSKEEVLLGFSRLYSYKSGVLKAEARREARQKARLLDRLNMEWHHFSQRIEVSGQPLYAALFAGLGMGGEILASSNGGNDSRSEGRKAVPRNANMAFATTVVPISQNKIVAQTINGFLKNKRDVILRWMNRADTYFPMIEQILREEGVPDELKYLAVVESGLNPSARSHAKAVGMWQFIGATGKAYGLNVTSWVDERMDPEKATRAAAQHLRDLYRTYGNWHVALAGYNCSPRCIKRAINKAGGSVNYWDIYSYLPRETRGYVPQFIAFARIMSNPEEYGLPSRHSGRRPYAYDMVNVHGMLSLADVANMINVDLATVKTLNPELRRNTLPPGLSPYALRLPLGMGDRFVEEFDRLPQESKRPASEYVVRSGDNLNAIAERFGVSQGDLTGVNNLRNRNKLQVGQRLVVPAGNHSGKVTLAEEGRTSVEYGEYVIRSVPFTEGNPQLAQTTQSGLVRQASYTRSSDANVTTHRVRRGESLGRIAKRYGTTVSKIRQLNNISGSKIYPGQRLKVSGTASASTSVHTVRRGESLGLIANRYGTTVSKIRQLNNISGSKIHPGQRLKVNGTASASTSVHTVRRGESLGLIANKYGTTVSKIRQLNNISGSKIHPGQRLKVNGTASASTSVHTVRRGESLGLIAEKYSTTVLRIRRLNNISGSKIYPGQRLKVQP